MRTIRFVVPYDSHPWPASSLNAASSTVPIFDSVTGGLLGGAHIQSSSSKDVDVFLAGKSNTFAFSYENFIPFYIFPIYDHNDILVAFFLSETKSGNSYEVKKR